MKNQVQDAEEKKKNPSIVSLKSKDLKPRKKAIEMKDIYAVKYVTSGKVISNGFDKKQDAKTKRNELCKGAHDKWAKKVKENKDLTKPFPYIVVKGKEHPLYRD